MDAATHRIYMGFDAHLSELFTFIDIKCSITLNHTSCYYLHPRRSNHIIKKSCLCITITDQQSIKACPCIITDSIALS